MTALRSGVMPSGRVLSETMPWHYVGQVTNEEPGSVRFYLRLLPALEQSLERTDR
jgi:hypothetical protein